MIWRVFSGERRPRVRALQRAHGDRGRVDRRPCHRAGSSGISGCPSTRRSSTPRAPPPADRNVVRRRSIGLQPGPTRSRRLRRVEVRSAADKASVPTIWPPTADDVPEELCAVLVFPVKTASLGRDAVTRTLYLEKGNDAAGLSGLIRPARSTSDLARGTSQKWRRRLRVKCTDEDVSVARARGDEPATGGPVRPRDPGPSDRRRHLEHALR